MTHFEWWIEAGKLENQIAMERELMLECNDCGEQGGFHALDCVYGILEGAEQMASDTIPTPTEDDREWASKTAPFGFKAAHILAQQRSEIRMLRSIIHDPMRMRILYEARKK